MLLLLKILLPNEQNSHSLHFDCRLTCPASMSFQKTKISHLLVTLLVNLLVNLLVILVNLLVTHVNCQLSPVINMLLSSFAEFHTYTHIMKLIVHHILRPLFPSHIF